MLGGAVWRARTDPLEVVDVMWGDATGPETASPLRAAARAAATESDWRSLIYPKDLPLFDASLHAFLDGREGCGTLDYRLVVDDGGFLWIRQWLIDKEAQPDGRWFVTGLIRSVNEEKRLQWESMRVSESERSRIGQEIHDDVCQVLAGINYLVYVMQKRLLTENAAMAAEMGKIAHEIQEGLERTRCLAHGLVPAKLNFASLPQALKEIARQAKARFALATEVHFEVKAPVLPQEKLLHIFRIVQEAASNSFKHGGATRFRVTLTMQDEWYVLTAEDDGCGLPDHSHQAEGIGLNVMSNRAQLLGGWLDVANLPQGGAVVRLCFPPPSPPTAKHPKKANR